MWTLESERLGLTPGSATPSLCGRAQVTIPCISAPRLRTRKKKTYFLGLREEQEAGHSSWAGTRSLSGSSFLPNVCIQAHVPQQQVPMS